MSQQEQVRVSSLCQGRYQPLARFFNDMTLDEVPQLYAEELLSGCPDALFGLMTLFVADEIGGSLKQDITFSPIASALAIQEAVCSSLTGDTLNFAEKIAPAGFHLTEEDEASLQGFPLSEVTQCLLSVELSKRESVKKLCLNHNNLRPPDLPDIPKLLELLPQCLVVDLSHNRLEKTSPEDWLSVCSACTAKYLIVFGNFLSEPVLKHTELASKLIWCRFSNLSKLEKAGSTTSLRHHQEYYEL